MIPVHMSLQFSGLTVDPGMTFFRKAPGIQNKISMSMCLEQQKHEVREGLYSRKLKSLKWKRNIKKSLKNFH